MSTPTDSVAPAPPTGSSNPWSLVQWWKRITDWIAALSPSGASEYDTGAIAITLLGGRTGIIRCRRVGKICIVEANNISGGGGIPVGHTVLASLPAGFPRPGVNARGACWVSNYEATAYVDTGGTIGVFQESGATRANAAFTVVYLAP